MSGSIALDASADTVEITVPGVGDYPARVIALRPKQAQEFGRLLFLFAEKAEILDDVGEDAAVGPLTATVA